MKKATFSIAVAILFLSLSASGFLSVDTDGFVESRFEDSEEYERAIGTDIPITVLSASDNRNIADVLSFGTCKIAFERNIRPSENPVAVIIEESWTREASTDLAVETVSSLIDGGSIVAAIGSPDVFICNPYLEFTAFIEGSDVFCIHSDQEESRYVCYSAEAKTAEESLSMAYCWMNNEISRVDSRSISSALSDPWGTEYISEAYVYQEGWGTLNISSCYFVLQEDNLRYNYYYTHYNQQSVPDKNRFTADMYTRCQITQSNLKLIEYAPTSTSGQTTAGISFGISDGESGLNGSVQVNWGYSVSDVEVKDRSNIGTNLFDLWHDLNEDRNVGKGSYLIQPGKMMRVDCEANGGGNGSMFNKEEYSIQFAKGSLLNRSYNTVSKNMFVSFIGLPHTLTIDSNGAEGCVFEDEVPGFFKESWSDVHSEGSYVLLTGSDYYKTGYTFAGYSTDPDATTAQYLPWEKILIKEDTTLYMVWIAQ